MKRYLCGEYINLGADREEKPFFHVIGIRGGLFSSFCSYPGRNHKKIKFSSLLIFSQNSTALGIHWTFQNCVILPQVDENAFMWRHVSPPYTNNREITIISTLSWNVLTSHHRDKFSCSATVIQNQPEGSYQLRYVGLIHERHLHSGCLDMPDLLFSVRKKNKTNITNNGSLKMEIPITSNPFIKCWWPHPLQ